MRFPAKGAVLLLPLLLTACFHRTVQSKVQPLAPPIEDAPMPKPVPSPTTLPPTVVTVPHQNPPVKATTEPQPVPEEKPKPPVRHKKPTAAPPVVATATLPPPAPAAAVQTTAPATAPPAYTSAGVSAIGQLTSGDSSDSRRQALDAIGAVERGLSNISRKLNDQEEKTSAHIREFLKQAKAALSSGDPEGAQTLAAKAKVLLGELSQ